MSAFPLYPTGIAELADDFRTNSSVQLDKMRAYARPVEKDGFHHDSQSFYVEIGAARNRKRIHCASESRIRDLLFPQPLLTKSGKPSKRAPPPDETGAFYSGQLLHYGLKPSNTKATAKKRLTEALESGGLEVPERIQLIERELRAEYERLNAAAEKEYEKERAERHEREAEERRTQIARAKAEFDEIDDEAASSSKRSKRKREEDDTVASTSTKKAKKGKNSSTSSQVKYAETVSGHYEIACPYVTEEWGGGPFSLSIGSSKSILWGKYDLGIFTGVIRFDRLPKEGDTSPVPCHWAGRENGEGEMSFGERCKGNISFLASSKLKGSLVITGEAKFAGKITSKVSKREVEEWIQEWEGYNDDNYEQERVGRWR